MKRSFLLSLIMSALCVGVAAQAKVRYSYAAQKAILPVELGQVYLGMPFAAFAKKFDLKPAEASARFGPIEVDTPYIKGPVTSIFFKVAGVDTDAAARALTPEAVTRKGEYGEFQEEVNRIDPTKVPPGAFVYEISVAFKPGFDLRAYSLKKYGPAKDVYKPTDIGHFYDLQWTKKTSDGLTWLIRFNEEPRTLQLIGVIKNTEWDPES